MTEITPKGFDPRVLVGNNTGISEARENHPELSFGNAVPVFPLELMIKMNPVPDVAIDGFSLLIAKNIRPDGSSIFSCAEFDHLLNDAGIDSVTAYVGERWVQKTERIFRVGGWDIQRYQHDPEDEASPDSYYTCKPK
jgi:hypothetical protein